MNVSEVQFGESNSFRFSFFFLCTCGVQEEGVGGAGVCDGAPRTTSVLYRGPVEPPDWGVLTH